MPAPTRAQDDLLRPDAAGLRCERAGFHIDPTSPVPFALITHAHADHATPGCGRYAATPETAALLRARLGAATPIDEIPYHEPRDFGPARVSFHPAGHVLGSAQIRVEAAGAPVWCVSGDYTVYPSPTARPFEPVACDVFVTESTFGLPVFRWADADAVARDLRAWCRDNAANGRTSVLFAYSLGKAQRVLAALASGEGPPVGPIGVHGAVHNLCRVYADHAVALPDVLHANADTAPELKGRGVIVAPPSQAGTPWLRRFAGPQGLRTAMVSGWMTIRGRRRWQSLDTGFILSDHADWPGLIAAVRATGAARVGVTHGYVEPFARYLREQLGLDAFALPTRWGAGEGD